MNFVRSAAAPRAKCKLGAREQLNQLSAYIDGGNIYGSSLNQSISLRSLKGGKLRTSVVDNREFLPFSNDSCAIPKDLKLKCFVAGDTRINEVPDLVVMHGIWLKEHNRIAHILSELNPEWNDETIYQETRRIVIAELQHIVYNEFLPIIIGRKTMAEHGLLLKRKGYSKKYSAETDASILSSFATAAYRFHSLIPGVIDLQSPENRVLDRLQLRTQFNDPQVLYKRRAFEMLISGLTGQPMQRGIDSVFSYKLSKNRVLNEFFFTGDNFFSKDVTNHLFQAKSKQFGMDLVSLNIQRGRDHGLPGYNAWRELCRLPRINSFEELETVFMNPAVARGMSQLYSNIDDIDLFMAGVSEKHIPDAIVGPTFACIIGEQFRRIKEGDRFWFENGDMESSFPEKQLIELRKSNLARILCDNSDVKIMQPSAMVQTFDWLVIHIFFLILIIYLIKLKSFLRLIL
jgi:peroxidase